jgi:hypothetical protein
MTKVGSRYVSGSAPSKIVFYLMLNLVLMLYDASDLDSNSTPASCVCVRCVVYVCVMGGRVRDGQPPSPSPFNKKKKAEGI